MTEDSFLVQLDENGDWFLGADAAQWIILRRRVSNNATVMQSQSFIGSNKTTLHRIIETHDIVLSDSAKEKIDSLPETFKEFYEIYQTKSGKGRRKNVDTDD